MDDAREPAKRETRRGFVPDSLDSSVIALPLMKKMSDEPAQLHDVVIDLNLTFPGGREEARARVAELVAEVPPGQVLRRPEGAAQYLFATLHADAIRAIVKADRLRSEGDMRRRSIFRVWPDFQIEALA
jgi:hypothetical protein